MVDMELIEDCFCIGRGLVADEPTQSAIFLAQAWGLCRFGGVPMCQGMLKKDFSRLPREAWIAGARELKEGIISAFERHAKTGLVMPQDERLNFRIMIAGFNEICVQGFVKDNLLAFFLALELHTPEATERIIPVYAHT